jgi:hypothetical protein
MISTFLPVKVRSDNPASVSISRQVGWTQVAGPKKLCRPKVKLLLKEKLLAFSLEPCSALNLKTGTLSLPTSQARCGNDSFA